MRFITVPLGSDGRTLPSLASLILSLNIFLVLSLEPLAFGWMVQLPSEDRQVVGNLLRAGQFAQLDQRYETFQQQYEHGQMTDRDLTLQYQAFYDTSPRNETYLNQWVTKNPKSYPARLARGIYYLKVGEEKRGGTWVQDTPPKNMVELSRFLDLSNADLVDSLPLTPKPIVSLLTLVKSSMHRDGKQGNRMWLEYANRVDPKNYGVRRRYMETLTPRWGGSYEEMWRFLKECQDQHITAEHLRVLESRIHLDQADMMRYQGQREKALPLFKKVVGLLEGIDIPEKVEALEGIVANRGSSQSMESVSPEIEEILRIAPTESRILGYRAWIRFKQGRVEEGLKDYSAAAELGDAYSQFAFGQQLYYGAPPTLSPNRIQGISWLTKAAEQGHEGAKQFLKQVGEKQ